jgi:hypothetical protein
MRVLRDGQSDLSRRLPYIARPMWLRTVTNRPVGPFGLCIYCAPLPIGHSPTSSFDGFDGAISVFLWSILYFLLFSIWFDSKFNLSDYDWNDFQCLAWAVIFESEFYSIFIILFYLAGLFEISVCLKGSPLAPSWYKENWELSFGS